MYPLKVICNFKLIFLSRQFRLHLRECFVDNRKENIEENKEYEEDIEYEVRWTEHAICLLQSVEIEITKDDT